MTGLAEGLDPLPEAIEWNRAGGSGVMVWLFVNDGSVTEIAEPGLAG